ncbi:FGFR1 oncogene partner 2 homolog [Galendromus occidentalis]|uniref:FGFR1 oncogene partner 2 homolog n=1 Tax=Galendromus occidentalis TaxID=34638 RepID=A0AAJ6QMH6_9ACAR|nr:FGFR1 oncogene partner 2 homolog [Galendromus occidentalis]
METSQNMSALVESARKLVLNLGKDDETLQDLHTDAMSILRKLETMKEYNDEVASIENAVKPSHPRSALVAAIQQENRQIKDLQRQNVELVASLEEHQSTLQMVMSKYRQQVLELTKNREVEHACAKQLNSTQDMHRLADKISEMAEVMRLAADIDENNSNCAEEKVAHYKKENEVLRELLQIASSSGSLNRESIANGYATVKKNDFAHQSKDVKTENGTVMTPTESTKQDEEKDCK